MFFTSSLGLVGMIFKSVTSILQQKTENNLGRLLIQHRAQRLLELMFDQDPRLEVEMNERDRIEIGPGGGGVPKAKGKGKRKNKDAGKDKAMGCELRPKHEI